MTKTFDRHEAGPHADEWEPLLRDAPELAETPRSGDHLVVLAAHPDDETLGAGGLLALAAAARARITVVIATDGETSHPESPTHSPAALAARRRAEVRKALRLLAPDADVHLLGLPDGRLAEHARRLAADLAGLATGCTHLVTPWIGDRHPDHEACARAAATIDADRHWQYPIWAWHWADPTSADLPATRLRTLHLDPATHAVKQSAIACHVSQHRALSAALGDEVMLSAAMLEHFRRRTETFVVDPPSRVSPAYFEDLYAQADDPWGLDERFYEARKRATVLAALTRPRFRRAFEPGCATGLLTRQLAARCDEVVAADIAAVAVAQTAERLADLPHAIVQLGAIPDYWPAGRFDLIVLSEVGYYCTDLAALARRVDDSLIDDGVLVACHWRHPAPLHPHGAEAVHAALSAGRTLVVDHVEEDFLLQIWTSSGQSVASTEGIIA